MDSKLGPVLICYHCEGITSAENEAANSSLTVEQLAQQVKDALEKIVYTEEPDAGVLLVSTESPTFYDEERDLIVHKHHHFSEMGNHLINLHQFVSKLLLEETPK